MKATVTVNHFQQAQNGEMVIITQAIHYFDSVVDARMYARDNADKYREADHGNIIAYKVRQVLNLISGAKVTFGQRVE